MSVHPELTEVELRRVVHLLLGLAIVKRLLGVVALVVRANSVVNIAFIVDVSAHALSGFRACVSGVVHICFEIVWSLQQPVNLVLREARGG